MCGATNAVNCWEWSSVLWVRVRVARNKCGCCPPTDQTPEHQRCSFFAQFCTNTPPAMFVAASEDLDDLFDIVQRVGARAAESSPGSPNDISEEGKSECLEVEDADDTEVDLIPTTVLEVQPKKQPKVSKVRMNHRCFRVNSIIKPTRRHCNDSPCVALCVIHVSSWICLIDFYVVTKCFAMFRCSSEFIHSILMGGRAADRWSFITGERSLILLATSVCPILWYLVWNKLLSLPKLCLLAPAKKEVLHMHSFFCTFGMFWIVLTGAEREWKECCCQNVGWERWWWQTMANSGVRGRHTF